MNTTGRWSSRRVILSIHRKLVGTSRCDVPARAAAGGIDHSITERTLSRVAPLDAAWTAQRAIPTCAAALTLLSLLLVAAGTSSDAATAETPRADAPLWEAKTRSEHQTEWATVRYTTNAATGRVRATTNSYFELGTGLNRRGAEGKWQPSSSAFQITATGAEVNGANHRVTLNGNINTAGAVLIEHGGVKMQGHPLCIAYFDPVDGRSELLAELTDAAGWLVSPSEIVFSNCFKGLRASIRYRNSVSGLEQDLLLHERPPFTPREIGFSDKTRFELFSEWVGDTPLPQIETRVLQREKDPTARQQMVEPDFTDSTLSFGTGKLRMAQGRAFTTGGGQSPIGNPQSAMSTVPVGKRFEIIDGRKILIEAVPVRSVQPMLDKLPVARVSGVLTNAAAAPQRGTAISVRTAFANANNGALGEARPAKSPTFARPLPAKRLAQIKTEHRIQTASNVSPSPGGEGRGEGGPTNLNAQPINDSTRSEVAFVLDWLVQLNSPVNNHTFYGTNTYHVTGPINLSGTTRIEGGTVVKFDLWNSSASLSILGPVVCDTSEYRPTIFTGKDDNSIGEMVLGSNGTPGPWAYGGGYLYFYHSDNVILKHLRVRYSSGPALSFFNANAANRVSHSQFVGSWSLLTQGNTLTLLNVLFDNVSLPVEGTDFEVHGEHVTARTAFAIADDLGSGTGSINLVNSLIVNIPSCWVGDCQASENNHTTWLTDDQPIFLAAGAGNYYLPSGSIYRDAGTANIDHDLKAALARMTTYPPEVLTGTAPANLILAPRPIGDTGHFDRGYHYPIIDYALNSLVVENNTSVLLTNGVVVTPIGSYGFWLKGGELVSEGLPHRPNRILPHTLVQEQKVFWNIDPSSVTALYPYANAGQVPNKMRLRFTTFDKHQYSGYHVAAFETAMAPGSRFALQDSHIIGADLWLEAGLSSGSTIGVTNTAFENVNLTFNSAPNLALFNNLFSYSVMWLAASGGAAWLIHDNLFRNTYIGDGSDPAPIHTHNAFFQCSYENFNTSTLGVQILPAGTPEYVLTSLALESGPFGKFYLQSASPATLINQGSRTAANAGLYHFTTSKTTGSKEGTDPPSPYQVDIGVHYVAANASKQPLDTDEEGLADYFEDKNGNGLVDSGETLFGVGGADTDSDGITDFEEFIFALNPFSNQDPRRDFQYDLLNRLRVVTGNGAVTLTPDKEGNIQQVTP